MTERKQFKSIVKRDYPNGKKPDIGGYASYFFQRKDDGSIYREWLTSGLLGCKWVIPSKFFDSWKEIYKEGKMYFEQ